MTAAEAVEVGAKRRLLTLTYVGRRLDTQRKLGHAWADDTSETTGTFKVYRKLAGSVIGGRYTVEESADGESVYPGTLLFVERCEGDPRIAEWAAASRVAQVQYEQAARERRAAREGDEVAALCEPLRVLMHKQVGSARRAALVAVILAEVTR